MRFAKLSKLVRVLKMGRIIQRLGSFGVNPGVLRLFALLAKLVGIWHFVACLYWYIATREGLCTWFSEAPSWSDIADTNTTRDGERDDAYSAAYAEFYSFGKATYERPNAAVECISHWMPWEGIERESLDVQYMQAFFWAVMVTSGIGYDVAPQTNIECLFTIFVIGLGIIMYDPQAAIFILMSDLTNPALVRYAAIVGSISSAIATIDATSIKRSKRLEEVVHYLHSKAVPARLRFEIQDYYSYKFDCDFDGESIMEDLPPMLQMKLEVALKKHMIQRVTIFQGIDPLAMLSVLNAIQHIISLPSELLVRQGVIGHSMIVVQQGRLSVSMNATVSTVLRNQQHAERSEDRHRASMSNVPSLARSKSTSEVWRMNFMDTQKRDDITVGSLHKHDYFGEVRGGLAGVPRCMR